MATTALLWAVHHDFLRYMSRIEDGQVAAVDGAQQLPDTDAAAPTRTRRASPEGLPKLSIWTSRCATSPPWILRIPRARWSSRCPT